MLLPSPLCALILSAAALVEASRSHGCDLTFDFPAEAGGPAKGINIGERRVWITLPKEYQHEEPAPLIIALHDKGMTPNEMEEVTKFSDPALNTKAIVLYPEAVEVHAFIFRMSSLADKVVRISGSPTKIRI